MPAILGQLRQHRLPQQDSAVCCRFCDPPQRVEIPAGVFYRLKDADSVTCSNGHRGTLMEYKQAAAERGTAHGPFIRYDHPAPPQPSGDPTPR